MSLPLPGKAPDDGIVTTVVLSGKWLLEAGFSINDPLKIRVMPGCLIITAQNFHELWHCLKSLNEGEWDDIAVAHWLRQFPGKLNKRLPK